MSEIQSDCTMRSHYCAQVNETLKNVELSGWVNRRRDHGGVIFIDLRDCSGLVQIVFEPENQSIFAQAETLRTEFVIHVHGHVRLRPEGMRNANLATGDIEVVVEKFDILNTAKTPPFVLDQYQQVSEEVRLRYRYLDLRRQEMLERLKLRARATGFIRKYLEQRAFLDIETPMLIRATPEGARDYLVPSRLHRGHFYALPQSPQLFKQLLMMSGADRYYQIVRCFRDEDLRADRQPEFTQLDLEASFVDETWIQQLIENMLRALFKTVLDVELPDPFPRLDYAEAMRRFGSDKPDLRNPLELIDVADLLQEVEFKVFSEPAKRADGRVVVLRLPNGCQLTRKNIDDYTKHVAIYGAKGLAYIKVNDRQAGTAGLQSPILKFLPETVVENILQRVDAQTGDILFFGADNTSVVNEAMGALRTKLGHDCDLLQGAWAPLWVVNWPMFERSSDQGTWQAFHHPFTSPQCEQAEQLRADPENMLARAYDIVLNGYEIGGGSVRIHDSEMQHTVFELLKMSDDDIQQKFGFFVQALAYGCPPHAGIALGVDRLMMLMTGTQSIRDVIAFPKTQTGSCLLTEAPSTVDLAQLSELGLQLKPQVK